jgi:hypothetical protein
MGMKEPQARKGNAASKGQQQTTDQSDKKIGGWKGGALGGNAGHSDKRPAASESKGAAPKNHAKERTIRTNVAGSSDPLAARGD